MFPQPPLLAFRRDKNLCDTLVHKKTNALITVYNHTCGVSALCSTGCLQIQPKKDEMVSKLSIFVVNKWISPKSLLQSTLELSSSMCIANKVESDQYFSQTPPASFLRSCKILKLFSLRVNLVCFPRSQAIVLSSSRYEQHFRRLLYARKWIFTAHISLTDKVCKTSNV